MLAEFLKLAEEHPAIQRGFFILHDVYREPPRQRWGEHKKWTRDRLRLWTALACLEELGYVEVRRDNGVNHYHILPECLPFLRERLALKKTSNNGTPA
jgi:hypothetical protein